MCISTTRALAIAAAFTLLLAPLAARAEIYRWTDEAGGEHFAMDLSRVPPAYRGQVKSGLPRGTVNRAESPSSPPSRAPAAAQPPASAGSVDGSERVAGRTEDEWRRDYAAIATRLEQYEGTVEECERMDLPSPEFDSGGRRRLKRQHAQRQAAGWDRCNQARSSLGATRLQLERFEERARKAGVPPGWLRN